MAQGTSFICNDCGGRIEDQNCPVVIYVVAGLAPMHPITKGGVSTADVTDYPMPPVVRELFSQPVARMEFCVGCFAARLGQPLIDAAGQVIASSSEAQQYMKAAFSPPLEVVDGKVQVVAQPAPASSDSPVSTPVSTVSDGAPSP
ncbi:MAG: hypothetical protein ACRD3J_19705 [Thermoanaerobaculia bacterium]